MLNLINLLHLIYLNCTYIFDLRYIENFFVFTACKLVANTADANIISLLLIALTWEVCNGMQTAATFCNNNRVMPTNMSIGMHFFTLVNHLYLAKNTNNITADSRKHFLLFYYLICSAYHFLSLQNNESSTFNASWLKRLRAGGEL